MSLLLVSLLKLSLVQVFGYDVRDILGTRTPLKVTAIKEGDCLRGPEVQSLLGVENVDLYYTYECGKTYPVKGDVLQHFACGLDAVSGTWSREIVEDDKPGFFWPGSVPCMSSVTSLHYANAHYADMGDALTCDVNGSHIVSQREESMTTKKYGVGQGQAYLPHPMITKNAEYSFGADGNISDTKCLQQEFTADYSGWGAFQIQFKKIDCMTNKVIECQLAKVGQGTDSEGHDCALIKKLSKCAPSSTKD